MRLVVWVFMIFGTSIACAAAEPEANILAKKIVVAVGVKQAYLGALETVLNAPVAGLSSAEREKRAKIARSKVSFDKAEPIYVELFVKTFTLDELRQIERFLESPAGKKYAANLIPINNQATTKLQPWFVSARRYMMEGR